MPKYANLWNIVQQSMGFLILYIAFNSSQNLQSRVMSELGFGNLGFYNLAAVQFSTTISAFFATFVIHRTGIRTPHCIGTIGITLWILSSALPACKKHQTDPDIRDHSFIFSDGFIYFVNIAASVVCGTSAAILWTVQGVYCSSCSTDETKGFYYGLFWFFYMSSQVFGNLLAAFVLNSLPEENFFYIMAVIASCSIFFYAFLRQPKGDENSSKSQSILQSPALQKQTLSLVESDGNNKQQAKQEEPVSQMIIQIVQCMIQRKMLMFIPQIVWTGVSIAYYSGMLVLMMTTALEPTDPDSQSQYKKAMLFMVIFGFGEIIGGFIQGYIIDKTCNKTGVISNLIIILVQNIFTILFVVFFEFNWIAGMMCFMWGIQDGALNTHTFGILGFEFDNNHDPFAVFTMLQGLACFVFQLLQSFVPQNQKDFLYYAIAVSVLGIVMNGVTYFLDFKQVGNDVKSGDSKETELLEEDVNQQQ